MILSNFGYGGTASVIFSLTTFMMLLTPLEQVVMQLMTLKSRRSEFQGDSFAMEKDTSKNMGRWLLRISKENKATSTRTPTLNYGAGSTV